SEHSSDPKVQPYNYLSNRTGGINKDSEYPEAILRMLDCAYAKEEVAPGTGLDAIAANMGPEGISYEVNTENNTYTFLAPPADEREEVGVWDWVRRNHGWNIPYGVYDFPYFNEDVNAFAREKSAEEALGAHYKDRFPDSLLKLTDDENTRMANKLTDIDSYAEQMYAKFITGVEPFSNWD